MLRLRKISLEMEGIWVKHKVRGEEIELKIRPFTQEVNEPIRKRHIRFEYVKDQQTRQMVKTEIPADNAIFEDLVDHILEDFKGIGYSKEEPLAPTKENKMKIIQIPPLQGEQPVWDFVIEKAKELAVISGEEKQAEIKNL